MNFFGGAFGSGLGALGAFAPTTPPTKAVAPQPVIPVAPPNRRIGLFPTRVGEFIPELTAPIAPPSSTIPPISPLFDTTKLEERGREAREYQAAEKARLDTLKAEVDARNRAAAAEAEAKAAQIPGANISAYYDALRAGEDPSKFADILQSSLSDQDYVSTGMEMAEQGAYGPMVDDRYIVPGGLTTEGLGEFKFDKTLEDFKGYDFDYGDISNENLKKFQEELLPAMAPAVAQAQLEGQSYQNALIQAYDRSPKVQEIYAKYDISPQRVSRKYGSEYVYDPFTFGEIQTVDRSPGVSDYVKAGALAVATTALGGALIAPGASPLSAATTRGLVSAGTTAATGGDPKDILRAGLLGGVSGYAEGLGNTAKAAETAAKGAKAGSELANAAELARKTSDTFNTVVKTGKFVDAVIDGNLATIAVATFGDDFTKAALDRIDPDNKFFSGLNINKSDLAKGLVKTQMELAKGVDFEDALLRGVGEYIMEGGALGPNNIKTPEFIKAIGDAIREAGSMIDDTFLQPVKEVIEPVVDVARNVGRSVDREVLQPVKEVIEPVVDVARDVGRSVDREVLQPVKEAIEPVVDVARDVGRSVDREVLQPVKEAVQEVTEPVTKPLVEGAKAAGEVVEDVAGVAEDVIEALPNPDLPSVNLPSVDLPSVNLPRVGIPPFFPVAGAPSAATPPILPISVPQFRQVVERTPEGAEITPYDFGEDELLAFLADNLRKNQEGMAGGGAVRSSYGNLFDSIHSRNPAPTSNLDELLRIVGGR